MNEVKSTLQKWLEKSDKIVVVGIGNELRKDDYVGVEIVKSLKNKISKRVMLIESETVPESFIEPITEFKPTHIIIVDAGLLGLKPGDTRLLVASEALNHQIAPISTHALPLRIFCEYLQETIAAKIALIVIQPQETDFGEGLSPEIRKTARKLTMELQQILQSQR